MDELCLPVLAAAGCWVPGSIIFPAPLFACTGVVAFPQLAVLVDSVAIGARGSLAVVLVTVRLCCNGSGSFCQWLPVWQCCCWQPCCVVMTAEQPSCPHYFMLGNIYQLALAL